MTEINLTMNPNELREIYFEDGAQKYFFGPKTKKQSFFFVLSIVTYPFYAWYSINLNDDWIFVWGTVLLSLLTYDFIRVAKPIITWRKSIEEYISKASEVRVLKVRYDDENFWHIQDELESKTSWSAMKYAIINQSYINVFTNDNYFLIPRNSMQEDEFEALSKMVMSKVKEVQKDLSKRE